MRKPIAHRGLHIYNYIYENSIASFQFAEANNMRIEIDVRSSRDLMPIVFHDFNLYRNTHNIQNVNNLMQHELKQIKLLNGDCICTLAEAIHSINKKYRFVIEIKTDESMSESDIEYFCLNILSETKGYSMDIQFKSFNRTVLHMLKIHGHNIECGLIRKKCSAKDLKNFIKKFDFLSLNFDFIQSLDADLIELLQEYNDVVGEVMCWTINKEEDFLKCSNLGFTPIFENIYNPKVLRA